MARVFPIVNKKRALKGSGAREQAEMGILLIDMSREIFLQNVRQERTLLTYLNSALSHEMRNPLNSIFQYIEIMASLAKDLSAFIFKVAGKLSDEEKTEIEDIADELGQSATICKASCKLLKFNIEDIVSLPQIKDGRLKPQVDKQDLKNLVSEVVAVQQQQIDDKAISLDVKFLGFSSGFSFYVDLLRIQQVLLNFYSNAIKYVDRAQSKILILV
jgi:signal transduction histidine kinase